MHDFDAIIVGARIAGSTTALLLAQRGYSVLLLDRDRFPSPTLTTHLFFSDSLAVFKKVGVLDQVLAIDAPRLKRLRFPYVEAPFPEHEGHDFALCIRRQTLDTVLVNAAAEQPNIELHTATRVTGLLRDGERVTGVRYRQGERELEARARLVIGADGRHSLVAREAGSEVYHDVPPLFAWYYGYFRDVPLDDPPSAYAVRGSYPEIGADYAASFIFPCDDGLTLVGYGVQASAFDAFRRNHRKHFFAGLRQIPEAMERIGDSPLEGFILGTGDLPNFVRVPVGPGWALVGDAGCTKDPHTVQGMGDAARGAVLLADAVDRWFRGDAEEQVAMADYHTQRDADVLPMFQFTTNQLQAQFTEEEWETFGRLTWELPELAQARVAAMAHAIPPEEVYSVEGVRRWLARA